MKNSTTLAALGFCLIFAGSAQAQTKLQPDTLTGRDDKGRQFSEKVVTAPVQTKTTKLLIKNPLVCRGNEVKKTVHWNPFPYLGNVGAGLRYSEIYDSEIRKIRVRWHLDTPTDPSVTPYMVIDRVWNYTNTSWVPMRTTSITPALNAPYNATAYPQGFIIRHDVHPDIIQTMNQHRANGVPRNDILLSVSPYDRGWNGTRKVTMEICQRRPIIKPVIARPIQSDF